MAGARSRGSPPRRARPRPGCRGPGSTRAGSSRSFGWGARAAASLRALPAGSRAGGASHRGTQRPRARCRRRHRAPDSGRARPSAARPGPGARPRSSRGPRRRAARARSAPARSRRSHALVLGPIAFAAHRSARSRCRCTTQPASMTTRPKTMNVTVSPMGSSVSAPRAAKPRQASADTRGCSPRRCVGRDPVQRHQRDEHLAVDVGAHHGWAWTASRAKTNGANSIGWTRRHATETPTTTAVATWKADGPVAAVSSNA